MPVFNSLYAAAYDLLYVDKDYPGEAAFVNQLVKRHSPEARTLLDLGSGTGRHALELMNLGYEVVGVELSAEMLAKANQSVAGLSLPPTGHALPEFHPGDVRQVRLDRKFDVVTALFHVMSYQTSNQDLKAALTTAWEHLEPGGIFAFDFWYGPAVLSERPSVRVKRLQGADIELTRIAEPVMQSENNLVEVNYEVFVRKPDCKSYETFTEHHTMRYLFLPEIRALVADMGWTILESGEWMTSKPPSDRSWGVYTVMLKS